MVLNNLAWLYQKINNDRAIELGERAFRLSPEKPEIVDTYGWILVNFGQYDKGLNFLKKRLQNARESGSSVSRRLRIS